MILFKHRTQARYTVLSNQILILKVVRPTDNITSQSLAVVAALPDPTAAADEVWKHSDVGSASMVVERDVSHKNYIICYYLTINLLCPADNNLLHAFFYKNQ